MKCECDTDYKEDSSSLKCTYNSNNNNSNNIWMIFFIIALVLLIISCVGIYFYVSKKRKADSLQESNSSFNRNSPIIQRVQYISSILQNVAIDDPTDE